jgi:transposase InsO family protein
MRKNGAISEYVETENVLSLKPQKTPGSYSKHKAVLDGNLSNHKILQAKRYPQLKNCVWSYHFMTLRANHGQLIWIFSVIDEHTQECLRCLAAHHINAQNVIDELFSLFLQRGIPRYLFAFNDNSAIPTAICEWIEKLEVNSPFVELKRYEENGYGILFREKLMKDISNEKRLASLGYVRSWLENWRNEHNRSITLLRV